MFFDTVKKCEASLTQIATAVRCLGMDSVLKAKSGHVGLPLGGADIGTFLYFVAMRHAPQNSRWINRDRFVLSAGHGSMLQYALLHLSGYELSISDLKEFRQWGSKTPGHPEYGHTDGIEVTTGPLDKGSPTPLEWHWQNACWQLDSTPRQLSPPLTTKHTCCSATAA